MSFCDTKIVSFSNSNSLKKLLSNCLTFRGKLPQFFIFKIVHKKRGTIKRDFSGFGERYSKVFDTAC